MALDFEQPGADDIARLDARLAARQADRWRSFDGDRIRPWPFFAAVPDERLSAWVGNSRHAIFLAQRGFTVEAVASAPTAHEHRP